MSRRNGNLRQQLRAAANAYANAGWPVFPLRPGSKRPATPNHSADRCDGSDPRCAWAGHVGWEDRATTDPGRIARGWDQQPYGIGIACGPAGLVVVDLDTAKGSASSGAETLAQLEHDLGRTLPATWTTGTPSGGRHLYYRQPPSSRLGNTAGRLGAGIDSRGWGGFVVAPPTTIRSGDYWLVDDHLPVVLPDWIARLLTPAAPSPPRDRPAKIASSLPASPDRAKRYATRAVNGELERVANAVEGRRNHTLFCSAIALGQLVGAGVLDQVEAEHVLLEAAQLHVRARAYSWTQARQTIASGMRRGTNEPRRITFHQKTEEPARDPGN